MDVTSLVITSLVSGVIIGLLSRIPQLSPYMWITGIGTIIALISYVSYVINYMHNPSVDGLSNFIMAVIPFVISSALSAKGEELIKNIGK